jgi:dolichyl-phosphate-mannose--protein O-mannosyl transferase
LIFFIFLSFLFYFLMKKQVFSTKKWYFAAGLLGLSLGISCSIKWTGFGAFALIFFLLWAKERLFSKTKKEAIFTSLLVFALPFLVYTAVFAIHFNLLPSACRDNCGNVVEGSSKGFNEEKPLEGNFIGKFF